MSRPLPAAPKPRQCPETRPRRWRCRIYATYVTLRWAILAASTLAAFIVVSAIAAAHLESVGSRATAGLLVAVALPLLVRGRLRHLVAKRIGRRPGLGGPWFLSTFNVLCVLLLCLGFSDGVGRSLRRRGDWFLGESEGWLPRHYRLHLAALSHTLERFDLPDEAQQLMAEAALPQPEIVLLSPPVRIIAAPGTPPPPPPPRLALWFHPLAGPTRATPPNAACRFGAPRPGMRPAECELGHCGIDMARPTGTPVYAVQDGEVLRVERDELRGGIAGRFVILAHKGGAVRSSYVHLHDIRSDLRPGLRLVGGEVLGTVGATGTHASGPHLHFAIAIAQRGPMRYIDPEPLLLLWRLPSPTPPASMVVARATRGPVDL